MKMLSMHRPRPSMLMAISRSASSPVNFSLVNLRALVAVKDLGPPTPQGALQRLDAKVEFHRQRQPPAQDVPAEPVHHRDQIDEALCHPYISDVGAPYLIDAAYFQSSQQVRVNSVALAWLG